MVPISRRSLILSTFAAHLISLGRGASGANGISADYTVDWGRVREVSQAFVNRESPSEVFPFELASMPGTAQHERKVLMHYFPPLPLSLDNLPAEQDYYETRYLQRHGEADKFLKVGGYLRERPLSVGPWSEPFWKEINFGIDVLRANAIGADGFGVDLLNFGRGRFWDSALGLLNAAHAVAPSFKIMPEPDVSEASTFSAKDVEDALVALANHPATFHLPDGRLLLSPFAPERRSKSFWSAILNGLVGKGISVAFLPILLNVPANAKQFASISYGMSEWGARDVPGVESDKSAAVWQELQGKDAVWMAPVAPQDARPKSSIFWEAGNTRLFRTMWEKAIRQRADYVHVVTWNDYGESTETSPSSQTQYLFYDLCAYYIAWYKSGRPPRILRDAIYYCHRTQLLGKAASVPASDTPLKLLGRSAIENDVEMIALLTAPATISIELGDTKRSVDTVEGLTTLRVPATEGRPLFRIVRNGRTVVEKVGDWTIEANPDRESALYVGGSSARSKP